MTVKHRFEAAADLWRRYRDVFTHFWRLRKNLTPPRLVAHEAEFLPAALSLQAKPVSPSGRWVARVLIALIAVSVCWAVFGEIDIVVNASGRIIPAERTKTIASVEVASVRNLYVHEGQTVRAGDLLVELDTRASDSERDKAEGDRISALLQAARSRALLAAIDVNRTPQLDALPDVPADRMREARQHLQDQWLDYSAKRERLEGEVTRYTQALPLAVQRAKDYAELAQEHDVSNHAWMEKEQARIDLEGQLAEARHQQAALTAETRKLAQDALNDARRALSESTQDARRAGVRSELLKLVAPVDGTVQQLTVHTVGGVVPATQALMEIVPHQSTLEVEAFIENKDVGFIEDGQQAEVKIEAFEYTKYGTVPARVLHVSRDAIQDEKRGLLYSLKVVLDRSTLTVDGREMQLTPGMSASVEVKTGSRRVIEYVLSPLVQHGRESLRER